MSAPLDVRPDDSPMSDRQLRERLKVSPAFFYKRRARGDFKHLELKRPLGKFRYSRVLVERWLAGESTVQFGRRRAS